MLKLLIGVVLALAASDAIADEGCFSPYLYRGEPSSFILDIEKQGSLVYLVNDYLHQIEVYNVSDPTAPLRLLEYVDFDGLAGMTDARLDWPYMYVTDSYRGLVVLNFANLLSIQERGDVAMQWGASAVEVVGDFAYVAHERDGLVQVSIANPDEPHIVASLTGSDFIANTTVAHAGRLAVGSGSGEVRIYDISDPGSVTLLCEVQVEGYVTSIGMDSTDLYIGSSGTHSWLIDTPLYHFDLTDVSSPTLISTQILSSDIVDIDVLAHTVCVTAEREGLLVFDRSLDPVAQYSHPTDSARTVIDGGLAYTALSRHQMMIIDLAGSGTPALRSVYADIETEQVLLEKSGELMYVTGNGFDNVMKVIDTSVPGAWQVVHQIDTITGDTNHLAAVDDLLLHAVARSSLSRLELYSIAVPSKPELASILDLPQNPTQMICAGSSVFLNIDQEDAIYIIDIADASNPRIAGVVEGAFTAFIVLGDRLYTLGRWGQVNQYDIADLASPLLLTTQDIADANSITVMGDRIVMSVPPAQFEPHRAYYYNVGPDGMLEQGDLIGPVGAGDYHFANGFLFVPVSNTDVEVWRVPGQGEAVLAGYLAHVGNVDDLVVDGDSLHVPVGSRILTYDLSPLCGFGCHADLNHDGSIDFFDVSAFLVAFNTKQPAADFDQNGSFNFFDVSQFLEEYLRGCP